jgi:hypothetical protein
MASPFVGLIVPAMSLLTHIVHQLLKEKPFYWLPNSMSRVPYSLFAYLLNVIGLDRFTMRTKRKVDTQWKLFCMVHNLTKIQRFGTGFA